MSEKRPVALRSGGAKGTALRRVAVVTGTRAEYGLLRSTMQAIAARKNLRLQIVATGTHLLRKFGHTIDDIIADGWPIAARVPMQRGDDDAVDQARGLAKGVAGIARFLQSGRTDIVVVLGDRIEAMAGALAGVTTGRIVAHIHGGDVAPGDFDDTLRHAITKLAHLHFPATRSAARRILRMGESPERVHLVGAPGLDRLRELIEERTDSPLRRPTRQAREVGWCGPESPDQSPTANASRQDGLHWVRRGMSPRALVVHHPCGRAAAYEKRVMSAILRAVDETCMSAICIYPNSDRGHSGIIEAIETHRRRVGPPRFMVAKSMPRDDYLRTLIEADLLIGNSSSGIIEAAVAGAAAVNIGPRQHGRQTSGDSVVHCGESADVIRRAIRSALRNRPITNCATTYGNGSAGRRIATILASFRLDQAARRKTIVY